MILLYLHSHPQKRASNRECTFIYGTIPYFRLRSM